MYKLSRVIQAHKRDARCLDYFNGILVTGGNDKVFNMYSYKNANYSNIVSSDIFEAEILSIKINRNNPQSNAFVVLGCKNGDIFAFDCHGNPSFKLAHNSSISSLDFIDSEHIVTGSWDGKAIVWSISQQKPLCQYRDHKYAVCVFYSKTNNYIVSGSQDKALNLWDWNTGKRIRRIQGAHNDIIRQISDIQGSGMMITCSNDQSIKIWSADLQPIQTLLGHTAFVFSVKALRLGLYLSGGEDRILKVWEQNKCIQDVHLPASVWSISSDQNGDIFVAGSDGFVRTFTTHQDHRADPDVQEMFNKQILQSSSKKSGMKQQQIRKLLTTAQMRTINGKQEGQIRVFRSGMVPEAYMWQNGQWAKIGDVITEGGGSGGDGGGAKGQPKFYPGDKYFEQGLYDYVFDVDDESGVPKVIPFNDGGNPMDAAERYCRREGLSKGFSEQIRKFLIQNSSKVPRNQQAPTQIKEVSTAQLKCTPSTSIIQYNDIKNPQGLINKLKQFNEKAEAKKLNQRQIVHIERIVALLESQKTYHTWQLDFKEVDTLKKILTWPKDLKFPVWDTLRAFLKHYQSQALFSGLQAGRDIITQLSIGLQSQYPQVIYALIMKTLSNVLIQNANKGGILKHADIVFGALIQINKRANLRNASYLSAYASFLFNFSIACIQKNLQKQQILNTLGEIIERRLQLDQDESNRSILLQAGANILFKYHNQLKQKYRFLLKYLQHDEVSSDIRVFY